MLLATSSSASQLDNKTRVQTRVDDVARDIWQSLPRASTTTVA